MTAGTWWMHLLWILAAGILGCGITAVAAGWLKLGRGWVVLAYGSVVGAFLYAYFAWSDIRLLDAFRRGWPWGLAGAAIVGFIAARNVSLQPQSARSRGHQLAFDLLWSGLVYGTLDGLFLSAMPLLAIQRAFSLLGWADTGLGTVAAAVAGLLASTFVTTAYHLGYLEFRGRAVGMPILGIALMTLGMILTGNALTAVVSHAVMHVAAVIHGMEDTIQLPPHYGEGVSAAR